MRIGIKVGSSLLTEPGNGICAKMIESICNQIILLQKTFGHQMFLVTSGAVASDPKKKRPSNVRAAVGMGRLMHHYIEYFERGEVEAAQVLLTDRDFRPESVKHLKDFFAKLFEEGIVPIVNANDVVDWAELNRLEMCADNDRLFANLCCILRPDMVIVGFDQAGVLDDAGQVIHEVNAENYVGILHGCRMTGGSSGHGQFGMRTKVECLRELASAGIASFLVGGHEPNFITRGVDEFQEGGLSFGTRFKFESQ
jgi:glutamate 5-kinase